MPRNQPRKIVLRKGASGLGFNIVGGDNGEGIFISFIPVGGIADLSGQLQRGDQLLAVNGIDLTHVTHEEAARVLKGTGETVEIIALYKPEEYRRYDSRMQELQEQIMLGNTSAGGSLAGTPNTTNFSDPLVGGSLKTTQKRTLYVRALFDFEPSKDGGLPNKGLAFKFGDILHVINASDDEWWQARRVLSNGDYAGLGIVPSKKRVERRERARLKRVNFHHGSLGGGGAGGGSLGDLPSQHHSGASSPTGGVNTANGSNSLDKGTKKKSSSLLRKFHLGSKSKESAAGNVQSTSASELDGRSNNENNAAVSPSKSDDRILSYEPVQQLTINYTRPIVILGVVKDRVNNELVEGCSERFTSCVPHTTRPRREHEQNGREYHFVTSAEQMQADIAAHRFIEAGKYSGNLYGTSVASVKTVAESGSHCVLDVSGNAIKRLQIANLHPIAILIKPRTVENVRQLNKRLSDEQAKKSYERALKLEEEFINFFTAIISGLSYEEVFERVKGVIQEHSGSLVWIPSTDVVI